MVRGTAQRPDIQARTRCLSWCDEHRHLRLADYPAPHAACQARKFDADGEYLRRWLPELKDALPALLHEPWKDAALLKRSGYPALMVDLEASRQAALAAFQAMRGR